MAIKDGGVAVADTLVVLDHDLGEELVGGLGGVVLAVTADITALDDGDGELDVEANVVTGQGLGHGLVVHLDGLDLNDLVRGHELDDHAGLQDAGLNTADGHGADTADLVHVLQGQTQGLVGRALWGLDVVEVLQQGLAGVALLLVLDPPGHVAGLLQHVVAGPAGDWHEGAGALVGNGVALALLVLLILLVLLVITTLLLLALVLLLVADLDQLGLDVVHDLDEALLVPSSAGGVVHLVDTDDQLLNTQGVGEQGVLLGGATLRDTRLEVVAVDDQQGNIGLGGTGDHVLDEVTVTRGVNDGVVPPLSEELLRGA
mmetsp:Transcript_1526/g.3113  ORF Transcript_1526/g.3113 Transcript_1526/m.3113 type:complete len:316 (-) Transcript_1526:23-970(-)